MRLKEEKYDLLFREYTKFKYMYEEQRKLIEAYKETGQALETKIARLYSRLEELEICEHNNRENILRLNQQLDRKTSNLRNILKSIHLED